ncbi:MAG TPA: TA system VapC family ribonuclease toxin [Gemmatimonadaceae bacterium]|nr:TA system VapC family ribonuclease toxin [Gemmatimonadaceae bacterium]
MLVAASRGDHPHHGVARDWLAQAMAAATRGASLVLLPPVVVGLVRLVTHARVFREPTPIGMAIAFAQALVRAPGVEVLPLGAEWPAVARLCETYGMTGNDVADAWIAGAVLDHHEHLVTFDRGFRRLLPRSQVTVLEVDTG